MSITFVDADFGDMYEGSWYTITGAGGRPEEWVEGYNNMLAEAEIGTPKAWTKFTGQQMNTIYHLRGEKAYQADLVFLAFPLDGLAEGRLAIFKLQQGDRWFDDIVDNNVRR